MSIALTEADQAVLQSLERKLEFIRAGVKGLLGHYHTGLFVWGEGGTGKSHTVLAELRNHKAQFVPHNSRLTARGLVDALQRADNEIHVIEDAETLFMDPKAIGVLRSALHSQCKLKPPQRFVTWSAHKVNIKFIFTGSIIVISNANLAHHCPEIRALKTRIGCLHLEVANDELLAQMKQICGNGFYYGNDHMTPDECWSVASFIRDRLSEMQRPLNLRLLTNGFKDYLQWKNGESGRLHWNDLLMSRIKESAQALPCRRADRIADETKFAIELEQTDLARKEKVLQFKLHGNYPSFSAAERAYYRRLQNI